MAFQKEWISSEEEIRISRKFTKALDFKSGQYVKTNWATDDSSNRTPDTIEFRFRAATGSNQILVEKQDNVIGTFDKFEEYQNRVKSGEDPAKILDSLGIERYCCRRMLLTSVETIQQVIPFYEAMHKRNQEVQSELE